MLDAVCAPFARYRPEVPYPHLHSGRTALAVDSANRESGSRAIITLAQPGRHDLLRHPMSTLVARRFAPETRAALLLGY